MKLTPVQIEALPLQSRKEVEQFIIENPVWPGGPTVPERNSELERIRTLLTETDELFASALGQAAIKVERQRGRI